MVQGGDPTGTGRGGTSIYGQKFEDEIHPELRFTGAGILAMANSGPNSNGSSESACYPSVLVGLIFFAMCCIDRLPIFHDTWPDSIFGRETYYLWSREKWDKGTTAIRKCCRRRPR